MFCFQAISWGGTTVARQSKILLDRALRQRQSQNLLSIITSSFGSYRSSSNTVKIVEVGPRDGLQNETQIVSVQNKVALIHKLVDAGCRHVETGSFVSPKWVPTMANTSQVMEALQLSTDSNMNVKYSCLVPNLKGLEQALKFPNVHEIAIFGSASEGFSQQNLNCSIAESLERFQAVTQTTVELQQQQQQQRPALKIRAYLSCVIACPYDGPVPPRQVAKVAKQLMDLGCHEISLGDTIGVGTPRQTSELLTEVTAIIPASQLAVHFHDTYGQALSNILVALDKFHITTIDSSVAGLGGCPYANGAASGNVATEDVVYMLNGMGVETGIDLSKLVLAGDFITRQVLKTPNRSKVAQAMLAASSDT